MYLGPVSKYGGVSQVKSGMQGNPGFTGSGWPMQEFFCLDCHLSAVGALGEVFKAGLA